MINRKIAPAINEIMNVAFIEPEKWQLSNGIKVYGLNAGSQELIKIDFIFDAGVWYQPINLLSIFANAFMNQGSKNYTAQQIAETFDSKGAYLQFSADQQYGVVSLFTLNKHLTEVIKVAADVIIHPTFPDKEVNAQLGKRKQQFKIENSKVKILAQKKFSQVLFGKNHPYANTNCLADYDKINANVLKEFHTQHYAPGSCKILMAGLYGTEVKLLLEEYFGATNWENPNVSPTLQFNIEADTNRSHFIAKADAVQSAIRIGKQLPDRYNEDFHGNLVLTTILGGYFGSRLMANIREDKGYTYGIGCSVFAQLNATYMAIGTEVGSDVTSKAVSEIYIEIDRLQNEPVGTEELDVVRNYMLGETLRNFDGIFALSNSLRPLIDFNLNYDHYDRFIEVVKTISPTELQILAQKHLNKEELMEVVAGKM